MKPDSAAYYRDLLRPIVRGRKCVLATGAVSDCLAWVRLLRELGAERPFVLAESQGACPLPDDEAEGAVLGETGTDILQAVRNYEERLRHLPDSVLAALDRYDPARTALVLASSILTAAAVAGRRRYAPRPRPWVALEDKVVIDAFWDGAGVRRAASRVVGARAGELLAAARALDAGQGTAWAGDAREGFNGGAVYLRWVRTAEDAAEAVAFFAAHCDRVRVMPFLEGVPCSIHGMAFADAVVAFRPVEMIVLRRPGDSRLVYAGSATYWDPPAPHREEMRLVARRVGVALREHFGYRGAFTVDGVMTAAGFFPTELNTRYGIALKTVNQALPELPLALIDMAVREGERLDFCPEALEELVVGAADDRRAAGVFVAAGTSHAGPGEHRLAEPAGVLALDPPTRASFARFLPDAGHTPRGEPLAPRAVEAFRLADREFGTRIGPLEAAREACPGPEARGRPAG